MSCGRPVEGTQDNLVLPDQQRSCYRCKSEDIVLQIHTSAYCGDCLCKHVEYKFRKVINVLRDRKVKNANLVLASSGSTASSVLQAILSCAQGMTESQANDRVPPIFKSVLVVHLFSAGEGRASEERAQQLAKQFEHSFVSLALPDVNTSAKTADASLHSALVQSTLHQIAKSKQAVLFTAETATKIAVRALSGLALGQGYALGELTASEYENDGVWTIRPLSTSLDSEIEYWAKAHDLPVVEVRSTDQTSATTIHGLCDKFVHDLDSNYSSTSSIIARTASKLGLRSANVDALSYCSVCGLPAQPEAREWREAITIAALQEQPAAQPNGHADHTTEHQRKLCYACHLVAQEVDLDPVMDDRQRRIDALLAEYAISDDD